jgi:hypothetical protein
MLGAGRRHPLMERGAEMTDLVLWAGVALLAAIVVYTAARPL